MIQTLICPCCNNKFKMELLTENSKTAARVKPPKITPEQTARLTEIAKLVCNYFDITIEELKSATKKREAVLARHYFFYLCLRYARITPAKVGYFCGGRDRTTTYHGQTQIENLVFTQHHDGEHLEELVKQINPLKVAS